MRPAVGLAVVLALSGCSGDDGSAIATETTTPRSTMETLLDRLDCDRVEIGSGYDRMVLPAPESEAARDCWLGSDGFRVHVFESAADRQKFVDEQARMLEAGSGGQSGPLPAVYGDTWLVYADSRGAANYAQERIGGVVEELATPYSYVWGPGAFPP